MLYAQDHWSLLLVFQAMDAAGKDGAIKHVMSGRQPAGLPGRVVQGAVGRRARPRLSLALQSQSAGARTDRHLQSLLLRGGPGAAGAPAVAGEAEAAAGTLRQATLEERFRDIRAYERYLDANGVIVRKFFLNVSRDEQKRRFLDRIDDPEKNWKFSAADARERGHWDDYMKAYEEAIRNTATPESPLVSSCRQTTSGTRASWSPRRHRDPRLARPALSQGRPGEAQGTRRGAPTLMKEGG